MFRDEPEADRGRFVPDWWGRRSSYNALFFTYALVLERFYQVPGRVGRAGVPAAFALGSFLGPVVSRPAVRQIGRRPMIAFTYGNFGP